MKFSLRLTFLTTSLLSFCSIIYELLFANTLALVTGNYIWWQSFTIGFFILGLGVGAFRAEKVEDPWDRLFKTEILLSFFGAISVVWIYFFHGGFKSTDFVFYMQNDFYSPMYIQNSMFLKIIFFFVIESFVFCIGYFSGFEIPIMMKIEKELSGEDKENSILGVNYIGTLIGSILFAFFLLPVFDVLVTSLFISGLNLCVCIGLFFTGKYSFTWRRGMAVSLVFVTILSIGVGKNTIEQTYLKTFYLFQRNLMMFRKAPAEFFSNLDTFDDVRRLKSLYQNIDIFNPGDRVETILTLDTAFQFSTFNEKSYHEAFSHIPIMMQGSVPRQILVLGGGDGLLIRELLKYDEIQSITQIELDGTVVELAKTEPWLRELNRSSLHHPKVKTILADAFYWLRTTDKIFDAIFIDFPYPKNYNLARLYSVEFYRFVLAHLDREGFAVLDAPLSEKLHSSPNLDGSRIYFAPNFNENDIRSNSVLVSTAYHAGFRSPFPYKVEGESFLLLRNKEVPWDKGRLNYRSDLFERTKETDIERVRVQDFPFEVRKKYVNSIFHPKILQGLSF